jgi:hypothetical protein
MTQDEIRTMRDKYPMEYEVWLDRLTETPVFKLVAIIESLVPYESAKVMMKSIRKDRQDDYCND